MSDGMLTNGLDKAKEHGVIPMGFIEERVEKDQYGNDVSLIRMCHGRVFRLMHRSQPYPQHRKQCGTVFAGRGKSVSLEYNIPRKDTEMMYVSLAGYYMAWGDGDAMHFENNPNGPDLTEIFQHIEEGCIDTFIVHVLSAIEFNDRCWQTKEVRKKNER